MNQEASQDSRNSKDAFFDPKPKPKMIRILTVTAYVMSVSLAAIMLSAYYIFMWHGEPHLGAHKMISVDARDKEDNRGFMQRVHILAMQTVQKHIIDSVRNGSYRGNVTEASKIENEVTIGEDMQQQLTALEAINSEAKITTTTAIFEDNTSTTWQYDYPDSNEDLPKNSPFLNKLKHQEDNFWEQE